MTKQLEAVLACMKVIHNIFVQVGVTDPNCVYACTNYVDRRLAYLKRNNLTLSKQQSIELAESFTNFINVLDANDSYFLPKSGRYHLQVPKTNLIQIIEILKNY